MSTIAEDLPVNKINDNIREDMVQTAVKFLENPNVVNTPLAQKQKFLQRKGLNDPEIKLACERSGAYERHEQMKMQNPPLPPINNNIISYGYNQRHLQYSWFDKIREIFHNVAVFSIVAYVIHKFYEKYIAPFLFGKKKKSIEDSIRDLDKDLKKSVKELSDNLESVKIEVDRINQSTGSNTSRQLSDLKSDVATVKGLLLGRKQFPSVADNPVVPSSIPAWQMSSVPSDEPEQDVDQEVGSGSGSSEPEHCTKTTSESSLEIIYTPWDFDSESTHSRKSKEESTEKE
ncbi:unnamed protein product [Brassicogethes aeneus]|uniref:Peroxisomal membrane protein PEX14 n=1 Tax=Brassicogethes aeneus TaxID=1431903 RepID=A0A9P0B2E3_BRAAE|nr:unnamed protein product [Brassicogethes aeneus]